MKAKIHREKIWFLSVEDRHELPTQPDGGGLMEEAVKATFPFQLRGRGVCVWGGGDWGWDLTAWMTLSFTNKRERIRET